MALFAQSRLLDWFYPPFCNLCRIPLRRGQNLCSSCLANLPPLPSHACLTCGNSFDGILKAPQSCPNCLKLKPAFQFATAALQANDDTIDLIHKFKLIGQPELGIDLAQIGANFFRTDERLSKLEKPLLIPVPLHKSRLRKRGFNQAEILAQELSRQLEVDSLKALKRVRSTPRQATLTRGQRLKNVKGSFLLTTKPSKLINRNLILIDDVFTTGATAHECARILRKSKPAQIAVFTILRA